MTFPSVPASMQLVLMQCLPALLHTYQEYVAYAIALHFFCVVLSCYIETSTRIKCVVDSKLLSRIACDMSIFIY